VSAETNENECFMGCYKFAVACALFGSAAADRTESYIIQI